MQLVVKHKHEKIHPMLGEEIIQGLSEEKIISNKIFNIVYAIPLLHV